jgi:excisionase family DNA binding protein
MSGSLQGIKEAAQQLGVSPFSVRRLIASGCIRSVTIGARRLIPVEEVLRIGREGAGRPRARRLQGATQQTAKDNFE